MATGKSKYFAWKFLILRILKEKGLDRALENGADNDDGDATDMATRERINDQALTILSLNIRDSQRSHIQVARNAKEGWEALAKVHQGIGSNGRMVLMQKMWSLDLREGQDMSADVNSFKELVTQVANLSPEGVGISHSDLVSMLNVALPEWYEPFIMAVQSRAANITFDLLTGRLHQEATRKLVLVTGWGGACFHFVTPLLLRPRSTLCRSSPRCMTRGPGRVMGRGGYFTFPAD